MRRSYPLCFALLLAALGGLLVWSVGAGSVYLSPGEILSALLSPPDGGILWGIRLPRVLAAAILGGALSVSGFLLQTFFANPIAGPFVLGISSGAKLTVSLCMVALLSRGVVISSMALILAAFAGSMLSMGFILLLSRRAPQAGMLVVGGVMIGYICSAITDFVVTFADDANIVNLHNWSLGSFSGVSWENVALMALVVGAGLLPEEAEGPAAQKAGRKDDKRLGGAEEALHQMGHRDAHKGDGPGKGGDAGGEHTGEQNQLHPEPPDIHPHAPGVPLPQLVGSHGLVILPACFLGGGAFCLLCDLIARTAFAPRDMSISSVTALLGAPIVLYLMASRRGGGGGERPCPGRSSTPPRPGGTAGG